MDAVICATTVPCSIESAFSVFTECCFDWWPREYTYSGALIEGLVIGQRQRAFCSELGPGGFRIDFGRVLLWSPPERLLIAGRFPRAAPPSRTPTAPARCLSSSNNRERR